MYAIRSYYAVPETIGNPLYHWTHLELRRPFGLTNVLLSPETERQVWDFCNAKLAQPDFSARGIMRQMKVKLAGTTDDPVDDLRHHAAIAADATFDIKVLPSWRPDKAFNIEAPGFVAYLEQLGAVADVAIGTFAELTTALARRLDHFAAHGCKIADHALDVVPYGEATPSQLNAMLQARRDGLDLSPDQVAAFKTAVLLVITSYSIHYTKLYDRRHCAGHPPARSSRAPHRTPAGSR